MTSRLFSVITTIQPPTFAMLKLHARLSECSAALVVAGDLKGPFDYDVRAKGEPRSGDTPARVHFLSLQNQLDGPFALARKLPTSHYSRKNIGYLHAMAQGASCIYETDDDNAPLDSWAPRSEYLVSPRVIGRRTRDLERESWWLNVYRYFTNENIWPRGLPLDEIRGPLPGAESAEGQSSPWYAPIQQGLVNNSPDVDAIWRLVMDHPFEFVNADSIYLPPGNWSPFNTQSTWWWPVAYPLLYVPSHCSFRTCDIWRSFVAQRCLWTLDAGVAFHAPEVTQDRNPHDLMQDFREEIPGYDRNKELIRILESVTLERGADAMGAKLNSCYEALVGAGFFPREELNLVETWLSDLGQLALEVHGRVG